ncbi:MAG: hypothetical protein A3F17_03175 [Gammaproteobacteria bacterium RIFCSPHIGHO2_12_FULL_41_15]|nr:MAG: hypothetical protein A3F17_03175 [Gammaproteobacteria bacterium RIFCSPHIGHO2_12_FULL_41_15]
MPNLLKIFIVGLYVASVLPIAAFQTTSVTRYVKPSKNYTLHTVIDSYGRAHTVVAPPSRLPILHCTFPKPIKVNIKLRPINSR